MVSSRTSKTDADRQGPISHLSRPVFQSPVEKAAAIAEAIVHRIESDNWGDEKAAPRWGRPESECPRCRASSRSPGARGGRSRPAQLEGNRQRQGDPRLVQLAHRGNWPRLERPVEADRLGRCHQQRPRSGDRRGSRGAQGRRYRDARATTWCARFPPGADPGQFIESVPPPPRESRYGLGHHVSMTAAAGRIAVTCAAPSPA